MLERYRKRECMIETHTENERERDRGGKHALGEKGEGEEG